MLTYSLVDLHGKSLYQYLYECIRSDIQNGILHAGEKLPSKRSFAKNLGISVITIEGAYAQLMAEGYIRSEARRGFFVADIHGQFQSACPESDLIEGQKDAAPLYDLVSTRTLTDNFPFATWTRLMRRMIHEEAPALMQIPPAGGVMELREAIAKHLRDFRQITVSPSQIIIGAGSEYLYGLLVQLLGRDRLYALETPGYQKVRHVYAAQDVEVVSIPMDQNGIRPDDLRDSHADVLQISPAHHFPTGIVTPVSRRYELLAWANESSDRFILEDDFDSELRLSGSPIPTLFSIDVADKVIYLNTFTKTLSPTIRISYMVLPASLVPRFHEQLGFYACTVPNFEQYTLAHFIREGFFEKHIGRLRKHYRTLRDALLLALSQTFPAEMIRIKEEEAGLHFLLNIQTVLSDKELQKRAGLNGIRISFLSDYDDTSDAAASDAFTHTAVLSYSGLREEDIHDVVDRLYTAWCSTPKSPLL